MTQEQTDRPRDYGGWRRRRGIGRGLGTGGTFTVLAVAGVVILVAAADPRALVFVAPPVIIAGSAPPDRRRTPRAPGTAAAALVARIGPQLHEIPGPCRDGALPAFILPGVLALATLLSAENGYSGRYGIVWDCRSGLMTATLRVIPASTWLADRADADSWVANWGGWLSSLGYIPMLKWVTVTVETAPEPGSTLADAVAEAIDPNAPARRAGS